MGGLTLLCCCYTRSPLSVVLLSLLLLATSFYFFILQARRMGVKKKRKHERYVHHSCNYEALCCIRLGRNFELPSRRATSSWGGLDIWLPLSRRVNPKNRDAVTSFSVYNRLCVWRVLYNTAINLPSTSYLSPSLEFNQLRSVSTRNDQVTSRRQSQEV